MRDVAYKFLIAAEADDEKVNADTEIPGVWITMNSNTRNKEDESHDKEVKKK